jgi:hypothetical protein
MTRPMVKIHDLSTDQVIEREMNDDELAQYEIDKLERQAKEAEQAAKDEAKAALLERLGITADEAAILLG